MQNVFMMETFNKGSIEGTKFIKKRPHIATHSSHHAQKQLFKKIFIVIQLQLYAFSPHPSTPPQVNPPPSPTSTIPLGFVHMSFIIVPAIPSSHGPHPTPSRPLLDCSEPQCLWLYFVCFFLLLIMFQLRVRSYGICPSPPGLFHLA